MAKTETVEVACSVCGEMTDVSPSHAGKLGTSGVPAPKCHACRRPARDAEAQAAALAFVEQLGDSAVELGRTFAALR